MIPVTPQPEPEDFDTKVRQKGLRWLAEHDIDITDPLPSRTKLPPYWRACLDELHQSFVAGRDGTFFDVGIDAIGVVLAAVLCMAVGYLVLFIRRKRARKS